jgi:hypothetical protein
MGIHRRLSLLAAACGAAFGVSGLPGCSDATGIHGVAIDSSVVQSADVSPAEGRTYEYDFAEVDADSVLSALWIDGLPVEVAWLPLDYRCEDARGARLTVQLTAPDQRMAGRDFTLGTGRLRCSLELIQFVVRDTAG